jgi:hypothetical protein
MTMKKARGFLAALLVLVGVSGCGENSHLLVHDLLVFWNEVCDNMLRATDEETAKGLLKVQFKILKKKQEKLYDRATNCLRDVGKEEAKDLETGLLDYYDEIVATEERLKNCVKNLNKIIESSSEHDSLAKIRDWPKDMKTFSGLTLGRYTPTSNLQDPARPKQFGVGLVPMYPQLTPSQPKQKKLEPVQADDKGGKI